jgi:hypothetical protein
VREDLDGVRSTVQSSCPGARALRARETERSVDSWNEIERPPVRGRCGPLPSGESPPLCECPRFEMSSVRASKMMDALFFTGCAPRDRAR